MLNLYNGNYIVCCFYPSVTSHLKYIVSVALVMHMAVAAPMVWNEFPIILNTSETIAIF